MTDKERIANGEWVECRICLEAFARQRLTMRYCNACHEGFCEGEHGNFRGRGGGVCVRCAPRPKASPETANA
jgi:hypothetical protein